MNVQNAHATCHLLSLLQHDNQCGPTQSFQWKKAAREIFPWMSHIMTFEAKKTCEAACFTKHIKITACLTSSR